MSCQWNAALFDELDAIYPDTCPCTGKETYTVASASDAFAGVHMVMSGLTPGKFVTIEVIGPDHRYKLFEMLPLPVEVNTGAKTRTEWTLMDINNDVIRRAPFMIYEVLKPCTNVLTAKGAVMALAFRCKTDCKQREMQKWEIILTHDGMSKRLTFIIEVFPVSVPEVTKEDHKYVNWFSPKAIASYHNVQLNSDEWYAIFEKYLKLAKYGRQNMVPLTGDIVFDYTEGKGETPKINEAKLDRLLAIFDKLGIYWIEGPHLAGRKDGEWEATQAETQFSAKVIPGEGEAELSRMASQLYDYIKKHKLEERWIQSIMDEPIDCLADTFKLEAEIVKKAMPGIKILEATIATKTIEGSIHYWCPTVDEYEKHRAFFDARVEKGDEIFVYSCLTPAGNFCNRLLDQERLRAVYLGWAPALYPNIKGFLHWGGMSLQGDVDPFHLPAPLPEITDYDSHRRSSLPAGDPAIMFPGFHEVYSSTRLEAQRIGLEDLVLLERVKELNPEKAKELIATVFTRYDDYVKDIAVYRATRRRLLVEATPKSAEAYVGQSV